MDVDEGHPAQMKGKSLSMWNTVAGHTYEGITLSKEHHMWTAGVVAIPADKVKKVVSTALNICDGMLDDGAEPIVVEQYSLSIAMYELTKLRELYADRVKAIGFSGHHLGIAVDSAAVALGAEWVERHFTLDRTWKGTDHAASLEPDGVRKLARDCRAVAKALTYKREDILDIEKAQRNKLKKNQVKW